MRKKRFIRMFLLAILSGAIFYSLYSLVDGKITWKPERAFLALVYGVVQELILSEYITFGGSKKNSHVK